SRIKEAATSVKPPAANPSEIAMYKSLLDTVKHPKSIGEYTHEIRQDPFSEYREMLPVAFGAERDFVLKSVDRMPLPLIYKGYIELPDRIIGQVDLEGATRFVKAGSTLNGYRILSVSRKKIEMTDASGKKLDFLLHRPVAGDELTAVLYDTLSKRTFTVYVFTEIGDYKVVDITPEYVILQYRDKEKKICF
ncbi:MAG: hypothetical protein U9R52_02850, partial [Candidatus Omnitrophota bacterium]|nr:hypothetical protein [Candidatus Omnitrophota bacterium]